VTSSVPDVIGCGNTAGLLWTQYRGMLRGILGFRPISCAIAKLTLAPDQLVVTGAALVERMANVPEIVLHDDL
jgi:hypothetical protein